MLAREFVPQDIQAYFSRPTRSINHARVSEIRDGSKHAAIPAAPATTLDAFLEAWPNVDPATGLHYQGDELLVKAREAMTAAVHTFNGAGLYFRAELFIVTAIISWTYLLHAYYKREGVDYRYRRDGEIELTKEGAEKYWDLSHCISTARSPLERGTINNLKFLINIRNEIEHRSTGRVDTALSAKLQACCLNFNATIISLFGRQYSLEKRLPIALQFVTFDGMQRASLIGEELPHHIAAAVDHFHETLSEEEQRDPQFRYRVAFVPKVAGKVSTADIAIEFVRPGSDEAAAVERILLKEVERPKYRPTDIVARIRQGGHPRFGMHDHSLLVRQEDARNPGKGFGILVAGTWYWYDSWLVRLKALLDEGWTRPVRAG